MPFSLEGGFQFRWTNIELTQAINIIPNTYGRIQRLGLFDDKPIRSTYAAIRRREGRLQVLSASERGTPPQAVINATEDEVIIRVPHFPWTNSLGPESVQDLFAHREGPLQTKTIDEALTEILEEDRLRADQTLEFMRMGALKGEIRDGSGAVQLSLFNAFDISKHTVYFNLTNANSNVPAICAQITDRIEDNLRGEVMTEVRCLVDSEFMVALIAHPSVEKFAVSGPQLALEILRQARLDVAEGRFVREYHINGVTFETYRGSAELKDGSTASFIEPGTGHAFPMGTRNVFKTHLAPAHAMSAVNQPGVQIWASAKAIDHDQGVELAYQMNAVPICARPDLLVEVKAGANPG